MSLPKGITEFLGSREPEPEPYKPACVCPRCRSRRTPWKGQIDYAAVGRACEELAIRHPVRVQARTPNSSDKSAGEACWTGTEHLISIHPSLDAKTANQVLCHELRHCQQVEHVDPTGRTYALCNALLGYNENPFEEDAEEFAVRMTDRYRFVTG